jgi:hypothetical protein
MSIETQDRALTFKMRAILAYAKEQMPESIICIFSFTQAEDDSPINLNKVATNSQDRETLSQAIIVVLENMRMAEIVDLTDTNGTIQ